MDGRQRLPTDCSKSACVILLSALVLMLTDEERIDWMEIDEIGQQPHATSGDEDQLKHVADSAQGLLSASATVLQQPTSPGTLYAVYICTPY